jgi:hypothetical protein
MGLSAQDQGTLLDPFGHCSVMFGPEFAEVHQDLRDATFAMSL